MINVMRKNSSLPKDINKLRVWQIGAKFTQAEIAAIDKYMLETGETSFSGTVRQLIFERLSGSTKPFLTFDKDAEPGLYTLRMIRMTKDEYDTFVAYAEMCNLPNTTVIRMLLFGNEILKTLSFCG